MYSSPKQEYLNTDITLEDLANKWYLDDPKAGKLNFTTYLHRIRLKCGEERWLKNRKIIQGINRKTSYINVELKLPIHVLKVLLESNNSEDLLGYIERKICESVSR